MPLTAEDRPGIPEPEGITGLDAAAEGGGSASASGKERRGLYDMHVDLDSEAEGLGNKGEPRQTQQQQGLKVSAASKSSGAAGGSGKAVPGAAKKAARAVSASDAAASGVEAAGSGKVKTPKKKKVVRVPDGLEGAAPETGGGTVGDINVTTTPEEDAARRAADKRKAERRAAYRIAKDLALKKEAREQLLRLKRERYAMKKAREMAAAAAAGGSGAGERSEERSEQRKGYVRITMRDRLPPGWETTVRERAENDVDAKVS